MTCQTCGGEGFVTRPDNIVEGFARYADGIAVEQHTNLGGVDACPDCTHRAEMEYLHHTQINHLLRESENDKRSVLSDTDSISGTAGDGETGTHTSKGCSKGSTVAHTH